PGTAIVVSQNVTEGKSALQLQFNNTGKGKAAISRESGQDLSNLSAMLVDITNATNTNLEVAVAFQTGGSWEWFESKPLTLKPGLNKALRFDLTKSEFKCSVSEWQHTEPLGRKDQLKGMSLLIFPSETKQATVYIDNLRFEGKSAAEMKLGPTVLFDGFESGNLWKVGNYGDPATLSLTTSGTSEGNQSLLVKFTNTGKGKAGIYKEDARDISGYSGFLVDMYNATNSDVNIAVAFITGSGNIWYESNTKSLHSKWNQNVRFDLTKSDYKAQKSGWNYTVPIGDKHQMKAVNLLIYPGGLQQGMVYIDNIRFEKSATAKPAAPTTPTKSSSAIPAAAPKITKVYSDIPQVKKYDKFEATVMFTGSYANPFDPQDITLDATLTSPSGKQITIPGFLYAVETSDKGETPVWKLRFAPNELGKWNYTVTVKNNLGKDASAPATFFCEPSGKKGYVRVNKSNPLYFQFENGEFYYPIGANVAWAVKDVPGDFQVWFPKYAANGANWARVWMSSWGHLAIEWKESKEYPGLGVYALKNAKRLDEVIESAEKNDIYIQLVLNYHGQFSSKVNPNWDDNPYNALLGGPLKSPEEVFTNEKAKQLFKQRYRYIVARWGYSPYLMAWELWNEVKFTDNYNEKLVGDWHQEMASYLKSIDPTKRMVTTSYADGAWDKPAIDFVQIHAYMKNLIGATQSGAKKYEKYNKPVFFGEIGTNAAGSPKDTEGLELHNALWSSAMTNQAGAAMFWYWDNYIEAKNIYHQFRGLAEFTKSINRGNMNLAPLSVKPTSEAGKYVDVTFGPVLGWEASTEKKFTVNRDGSVSNLNGLSSYFQGPNKPEMKVTPLFKLDCPQDSEFIFRFNQVSGWGSGIKIYLDDKLVATRDWAATPDKSSPKLTDRLISFPIPKGNHQVKIDVYKDDWVEVDDITITNYATPVRAYALGDKEHAFIWVYNQGFTPDSYYAGKLPMKISNAKLEVANLLPKSYTIEYWDTYAGKIIQTEKMQINGTATLNLPSFDKDIAIKIY
ncbi:MAG: DUF5060 domain-containing protein, partial [bacterium]|nr:DUF5060 domain-containing protein [bacterium]